MIRGTYLIAGAVAILWCAAVGILLTLFNDWFFTQSATLVIAAALLLCPLWGIAMLARIFDVQDSNEIAVKDMQNLMISIERQIYDRVTQSTFTKPVSTVVPVVVEETPVSEQPEPAATPQAPDEAVQAETDEPIQINFIKLEDKEGNEDEDTKVEEPLVVEVIEETSEPEVELETSEEVDDDEAEETQQDFSWISFINAADFPQDVTDTQTLKDIEVALKDPDAARFLQSAEDFLALLAENNLFMEDYEPNIPELKNWQNQPLELSFNRPCLKASRSIAKMLDNEDMDGFQSTANTFSTEFDATLERIFEETDGREVLGLSDTRAGRAYLLLTRARQIADSGKKKVTQKTA